MDIIKVALIQLNIAPGQKQVNLDRVSRMISRLTKKVDLVCLPELFTTGYTLKSALKLSETIDGPTVEFLSGLASELKSNIIGGSFIEKNEDKLYNTSTAFNRDGQLIGCYRKTHLFSFMKEIEYLSAGDDFPEIMMDFGPVGILICYDLRFPEVSRVLAVKGVKMLVYPSNFPNPRYNHWKTLLAARALENQLYTIGINRVGYDKDNSYFGHSLLANPWGEVIFEARDEQELSVIEVDLREINKARTFMPCLSDRRPDIYGD